MSGGRSRAAPPCHPSALPFYKVTNLEGSWRMEKAGSNLGNYGTVFRWGNVVYVCVHMCVFACVCVWVIQVWDKLEEPTEKHIRLPLWEREREKGWSRSEGRQRKQENGLWSQMDIGMVEGEEMGSDEDGGRQQCGVWEEGTDRNEETNNQLEHRK